MKPCNKTARQAIIDLGKRVCGMSQAEVARAVGCSRERVRQLCVHLPYKPRSRRTGDAEDTVNDHREKASKTPAVRRSRQTRGRSR